MRTPYRRNIVGVKPPKKLIGLAPIRVPVMEQNRGLNITLPKAMLGLNWFSQLNNMIYHHGVLRTRFGLTQLGTDESSSYGTCVGLTEFVTSFGFSYLVAFYPNTIRYWNGSSWATAGGTYTLTGTNDDFFTWTGFNNYLIFSNGIDGTFKFDPVNGIVTKITAAPAAYHLTTFNGRLIASNVRNPNVEPSTIMWTVKGDENDWSGIGSGNEPLLSTPGGQIDQQTGVYPISDYNALVIRSNSVWMMTASGNVEVPFTFERLYANFGSKYRQSLQVIPEGVIGLFNDNIYIVTEKSIDVIGEPVVVGLAIPENSTADGQASLLSTSAFSQSSREYIIIPNSASIGVDIFYRYNIDEKKWTQGNGKTIRCATYLTSASYGLTIDSSTGTIDAAGTASIDSEVASVGDNFQDALVLWTKSGASAGQIFVEDRYVDSSSSSDIRFGFIPGVNPDQTVTLTKVYLVYETEGVTGQLTVEAINDLTHINLSVTETLADTTTTGPRVLSITAPSTGRNVEVHMSIASGTAVHILDIKLDIITGADEDTWTYT